MRQIKRGRSVVITLIDIYSRLDYYATELYHLLAERTPEQSISHRHMPTMKEHLAFIESRPYQAWYEIVADARSVGAVYLSKQREIGVAIFARYWGNGYGKAAVSELMRLHPGRYLANVNPANAASRALFEDLGGKLIQVTYELPLHRSGN